MKRETLVVHRSNEHHCPRADGLESVAGSFVSLELHILLAGVQGVHPYGQELAEHDVARELKMLGRRT